MLRISVADMLLPTVTTWGRPVRKSRIQLQRELFSSRVLSLLMSFEGTMVLNAELSSNQIVFFTYSWLADVNASVVKFLCFWFPTVL